MSWPLTNHLSFIPMSNRPPPCIYDKNLDEWVPDPDPTPVELPARPESPVRPVSVFASFRASVAAPIDMTLERPFRNMAHSCYTRRVSDIDRDYGTDEDEVAPGERADVRKEKLEQRREWYLKKTKPWESTRIREKRAADNKELNKNLKKFMKDAKKYIDPNVNALVDELVGKAPPGSSRNSMTLPGDGSDLQSVYDELCARPTKNHQ